VTRLFTALAVALVASACTTVETGSSTYTTCAIPACRFFSDPFFKETRFRTFPADPVYIDRRFYGDVVPWWMDQDPPLMRMRGVYSTETGTAEFRDCNTGNTYPMFADGDVAELESKYSAAAATPGAPVHMTFDGRVLTRERADGKGVEEAVRVDKFERTLPGSTCDSPLMDASLTDTHWILVELNGVPVPASRSDRRPGLLLVSSETRASGFGGCNAFTGSYRLQEYELALGPLASTQVACPPGTFSEAEYLKTLGSISSWWISGDDLALVVDGYAVARFVAAGNP